MAARRAGRPLREVRVGYWKASGAGHRHQMLPLELETISGRNLLCVRRRRDQTTVNGGGSQVSTKKMRESHARESGQTRVREMEEGVQPPSRSLRECPMLLGAAPPTGAHERKCPPPKYRRLRQWRTYWAIEGKSARNEVCTEVTSTLETWTVQSISGNEAANLCHRQSKFSTDLAQLLF